jgi:hypothetical protein
MVRSPNEVVQCRGARTSTVLSENIAMFDPHSGSSSYLVIQGHCNRIAIATSESRVRNSNILMNQWRNRAFSRDQLGHELAFTKIDDEPSIVVRYFCSWLNKAQ